MAQPALLEDTPRLLPRPDSIIVLEGATWADYQRVMEMRGDKSVPRVAYLEGVIELMSPSMHHEVIKSMIGCLVEAWCMHRGVDLTPYGAWTHENKAADRGAEPDECYVLGNPLEPKCCDLAIEVIWTSGSLNKLEIYRKLGVREVWIWKDEALRLYELHGEEYVAIETSHALPGIDLAQLLSFVEVRPMTRAVREYVAALTSG